MNINKSTVNNFLFTILLFFGSIFHLISQEQIQRIEIDNFQYWNPIKEKLSYKLLIVDEQIYLSKKNREKLSRLNYSQYSDSLILLLNDRTIIENVFSFKMVSDTDCENEAKIRIRVKYIVLDKNEKKEYEYTFSLPVFCFNQEDTYFLNRLTNYVQILYKDH